MSLRDELWTSVACVIADSPALLQALKRNAGEKPYFPIGPESDPYMLRAWLQPRWSLMDRGDGVLEPKSWHRRLWSWLPSIRMHKILRPDADRCLHDHPAAFRSLIVSGFYVEDALYAGPRPLPVTRWEGTSYFCPAERMHRIAHVSKGGVWTIVIWYPTRRKDSWGFLVNGIKVPWRQHIRAEHSLD